MRLRYSYPWPSTKYRPMKKVSTYHSRRPHLLTCQIRPDRRISPRSTANTPIWQVTLDSSSTVVLVTASAMFRWAPGHGWPWLLSTARIVKYIANSAAKNMSSEDSQTMVPTLTRFGRLAGDRGTGVWVVDTDATRAIITTSRRGPSCDPPSRGGRTPWLAPGRYHPHHEGRHLQPRRGHPRAGPAGHRPPPGTGRAGGRADRCGHRARTVPAAGRGRGGRHGARWR